MERQQTVYCFYLPAYRSRATAEGSSRWPIKIGMTTGELRHRINQHRTALPEEPVVAFVIRTDNAALLEKILHNVLTFRGRQDVGTGGSEWFITCPEEIARIYSAILADGSDSVAE